MEKIKIYIIDDHEHIIVSGFLNWFRPGRDKIECSGSSVNVKKALEDPKLKTVNVILLDLWIPFEKTMENVKVLGNRYPQIPIIIYTSEDTTVWFEKMIAAGVKGYLIKEASRADVKSAILMVAEGGTWFTPRLMKASESDSKKDASSKPSLEKIEKIILLKVIQGCNHKEVAKKLDLKTHHIEKILSDLRNRFEATNKSQLVKILSDLNLI